LLLLLGPPPAQASAWTRPAGTGYLKLYIRSLIGRHAYVDGRTMLDLGSVYQDHQLNAYGEWGVTDDLTVSLEGNALGLTAFNGEVDPYMAGVMAAVRYRLQVEPFVLSLQLHGGGRPALAQPTGVVDVDGRTIEVLPVVGTLVGGGSVRAGWSVDDVWLSTATGLRFHSSEALDTAIFAQVQVGWHLSSALTIAGHLHLWHALGDLGPVNVLGAAQTRYLGFGVGATWWLWSDVGLHAGFDGVVYAYNNAATPSLLLGLEFR
ncbi:unnamed protein product, partial [Laminaria digitata]